MTAGGVDTLRAVEAVRRDVLEMIAEAGSGHPGSSLSVVDILTVLHLDVLKLPGTNDPHRDRLILSKGHAAPALYAILRHIGVLPRSGATLRAIDSMLQGHPDRRFTPGVEVSSGSLGQGMSTATGLACGLRRLDSPARVFVVLGDGETQEGQVWEGAMAAAHFGADNLTAIVDANGLQHDGRVDDVMGIEPLVAKWQAFGWHAVEVDGHDHTQLREVLTTSAGGRPTAVVARTTKGRGVEFMEDTTGWHSVADQDVLRQYVSRWRTDA